MLQKLVFKGLVGYGAEDFLAGRLAQGSGLHGSLVPLCGVSKNYRPIGNELNKTMLNILLTLC